MESQLLSELTDCRVHLKFENLQYTGSFKERGACNKLLLLTDDERSRGVIAMSAGSSLPSSPVRATVRTREAGRDYGVSMEVTHQPLGA